MSAYGIVHARGTPHEKGTPSRFGASRQQATDHYCGRPQRSLDSLHRAQWAAWIVFTMPLTVTSTKKAPALCVIAQLHPGAVRASCPFIIVRHSFIPCLIPPVLSGSCVRIKIVRSIRPLYGSPHLAQAVTHRVVSGLRTVPGFRSAGRGWVTHRVAFWR